VPKAVDIEKRRGDLAAAAARLIARSGIGAATLRDVAAEAGWTTGALTHYFADKHELLMYTFQVSLDHRRSFRPPVDGRDPRLALRTSLEGALPLDADRRRHWMVTIALAAQAAGDPTMAAVQRDAYREHCRYVTELVTECRPEQPGSARRLAERLVTIVDGIAFQAVLDPESWPPARQLEALDDMVQTVR
jgi:AcrR family transcriptional regulator